MPRLPRPHYVRQDSDPQWLAFAAQFHGHLGPWATAGTRLGMAGLREVGGEGYFDVEVECQGPFVRPPKSCFLDGLQVATGATLGKRNLSWKHSGEIVVYIKNTRTGRQTEVRPTPKLMSILGSLRAQPKGVAAEHPDNDRHQRREDGTVENLARRIAKMPDSEILTLTRPSHHWDTQVPR